MDIRIGITNATRELNFETSQSAEQIQQAVEAALSGESKLLTLQDSKGKVFLVPSQNLAYVEVGAENARRVGFVA